MRELIALHQAASRDGFVDVRLAAGRYGIAASTVFAYLRRIGYEPYLPGLWTPPGLELSHRLECRAAQAYFGDAAIVTGASALFLLDVLTVAPPRIELLVPARGWRASRGRLCVHTAIDHGATRTLTRRGVRIAHGSRATADYSRHVSVSTLCRVIPDVVRLRHSTLGLLRVEIDQRPQFPGRGRLRRAVDLLTGELNHSSWERLGRRLLREDGIDTPSRPGPVLAGERVVAEVDIPFSDIAYGVEIDGPPHLLPEQAARDRARDRMLQRDHGWVIDRYLWHELEDDPVRFVREVRAQLERRR